MYYFNNFNKDAKLNELNDFDDIECHLKYFNKYYKYFNKDSNLLNWLNDLFIVIFDLEKNKKIIEVNLIRLKILKKRCF